MSGWPRFVVGRRPLVTLLRLAVLLLLYFSFFRGTFQPIRVTGVSMEPTYRHGQIKLLNMLAYRRAEPQRGDVVAVRNPDRSLRVFLKRVVALPGERVSVRAGRVFLDGRMLEEPWAFGRGIPHTKRSILLGSDQYFVIGDNRKVTAYQVVERQHIMGRTK